MNIPMIDTLYVHIDIEDYENTLKEFLNELEKKKTEAKLAGTNSTSAKVNFQIGNHTFEILPNGSSGHAYILHNNEYEIKFSQFRSPKKEYSPVILRIKSEYLWAIGYENAWQNFKSFFEKNIATILTEQVSRPDLCCHTDNLILNQNDETTFKGTYFSSEIKKNRRKVSGMTFGSRTTGRIYCRIYDKTLEVRQMRQKMWFFKIWQDYNLDIENVWNVEFEIKRDFLRRVGINTVEDLFSSLKTVWEFCTYKWLVKTNADRTRIERSTTNSKWESIQHAFDNCSSKEFITTIEQKQTEANTLIPGIIGNLTTYGAKVGINNYSNVLNLVSKRGNEYLNNKQTDFKKEVIEKRKTLIQESEVNTNE